MLVGVPGTDPNCTMELATHTANSWHIRVFNPCAKVLISFGMFEDEITGTCIYKTPSTPTTHVPWSQWVASETFYKYGTCGSKASSKFWLILRVVLHGIRVILLEISPLFHESNPSKTAIICLSILPIVPLFCPTGTPCWWTRRHPDLLFNSSIWTSSHHSPDLTTCTLATVKYHRHPSRCAQGTLHDRNNTFTLLINISHLWLAVIKCLHLQLALSQLLIGGNGRHILCHCRLSIISSLPDSLHRPHM